jgi:hypothetical protein
MNHKRRSQSHRSTGTVITVIGWLGVGAILAAYGGSTLQALSTTSYLYIALNIVGSVFLMIETYHLRDYQPFVLNLVWLALAGISLLRVG